MAPKKNAEAPVPRSLICGKSCNELVMKEIFTEGFHEFVWCSLRSYCITHKNATLNDLARHTTSLRALQERAEVDPRNSLIIVEIQTPPWYVKLISKHEQLSRNGRWYPYNDGNASEKRCSGDANQIQSAIIIYTPARPSTSKTIATNLNSAHFFTLCLEKAHCQAQCPLLPIHFRQQFAAQRNKT